MTSIGYVRVSTGHQVLDQQEDALRAAGVEKIFSDVMSGARNDRPGLLALLDYARPGDTVTVVALDRLGRSLSGIVNTVEELRGRGIALKSLREGVDSTNECGQLLIGIFGSLAQYERSLINERAAAAREAARVRGRQVGRPRALTDEMASMARQMRTGGMPVPTIAAQLKVSAASVYRVLAAT